MRSITRIHPGRDDDERRFFSRGARRRSGHELALLITEEELLADLDPGLLTWRATGCTVPQAEPAGHATHLHDVA